LQNRIAVEIATRRGVNVRKKKASAKDVGIRCRGGTSRGQETGRIRRGGPSGVIFSAGDVRSG